MATPPQTSQNLGSHGASALPSVTVESWNIELRDGDGFVGDRASKGAFEAALREWRALYSKSGIDPLGEESDIGRKKLEKILLEGDAEAAGLVHSAIEDFAQQFAEVIRRFLRTKEWKDVARIAVGGGLRASRLGEIAIGRTAVLLRASGVEVGLQPIHNDPDAAGLIGAVQLAPAWIFGGHDSILAADIGGTNIRAAIVILNQKKAADLSKAEVHAMELWRHRSDKPTREQTVDKLAAMLQGLAERAPKDGLQLAPFIGVGCPGIINQDGTIDRGAHNLPGNWHSKKFNLPALLTERIPTIGDHKTALLMHNDAVMQGLSEVPHMRDVERWAVLTIGTGLGNASFANRQEEPPAKPKKAKAD